ncbi:MAG TPA: DUF554 domain-containing protein [Eggerthellaceae bacterium]|nr:DUF554 domain-containing protein [Eggerthellaceae bacterium]
MGTIINVVAIAVAGLVGMGAGKLLSERLQEGVAKAAGVCVLFIGIAGALQGMLAIEGGMLASGKSLFVVISIVVGTLVGEAVDFETLVRRFGEWLKLKTGNAKDRTFVDAFVTASIVVCVGAMAVIGAIQDAMQGDISILCTKALLDFVIIVVMTCSLGRGCAFSAIPVGVFQGSITALSVFIRPFMTDSALAGLSLVGSILVFCVGVNLVWDTKLRVANMLPAIIVAPLLTFLPVAW